jgi:hypothetical protein
MANQVALNGSLPDVGTSTWSVGGSDTSGYGATTPGGSETIQQNAEGAWTYADGDTYTPATSDGTDGSELGLYDSSGQLIAGDGNMYGTRSASGLLGDMESNTQDAVSTSLGALTNNGQISGQPDPQSVLLDVTRILSSEGYTVSGMYSCPNGYAVTVTDPNGGGIAIISASNTAVDITQQTSSGGSTPFNSEFRQQNIGGFNTTMFRMAGWAQGVYLPSPGFGPPSPNLPLPG